MGIVEDTRQAQFNDLLSKGMQVEFDGKVLTVYPLTVREMDILAELENEATKPKAMQKLIINTLRKSFPGHSDNEYMDLPLNNLKPIMDAIKKVNGLSESGVSKNQ